MWAASARRTRRSTERHATKDVAPIERFENNLAPRSLRVYSAQSIKGIRKSA